MLPRLSLHHYSELIERADAILRAIPRSPSSPHYTDATFERKLRLARQRETSLRPRADEPVESVLLRRTCLARVIASAGLTGVQRRVLEARLRGDKHREIGERFGHTKQGSLQIFKQALAKLRRAWLASPYFGLHEVYLEEVRRFAPGRLGRRKTTR